MKMRQGLARAMANDRRVLRWVCAVLTVVCIGVARPLQADEIRYPAIISFGMDGCAPCAKMKPVIDSLRRDNASWLRVESVNILNPAGKAMAKPFGITGVPAQVLVDRGGSVVAVRNGVATARELVEALGKCGVAAGVPAVRGPEQPLAKWVAEIRPLPAAQGSGLPADKAVAPPERGIAYRAYYIHETVRSGCSSRLESGCLANLVAIYGKGRVSFVAVDMEDPANAAVLAPLRFSKNCDFARGICVVVKVENGVEVKQVALDDLVNYKDEDDLLDQYIASKLGELER